MFTNSPWYIRYENIHTDLDVSMLDVVSGRCTSRQPRHTPRFLRLVSTCLATTSDSLVRGSSSALCWAERESWSRVVTRGMTSPHSNNNFLILLTFYYFYNKHIYEYTYIISINTFSESSFLHFTLFAIPCTFACHQAQIVFLRLGGQNPKWYAS